MSWREMEIVEVADPNRAVDVIEVGVPGPRGISAYDVAVRNGFQGSETEWLESLDGVDGASAYEIALAGGFQGSEGAWLDSLVGPQGETGAGLTILGALDSTGELPASGERGDGYLIDGDLHVWTGDAWVNAGSIQGPPGPGVELGGDGSAETAARSDHQHAVDSFGGDAVRIGDGADVGAPTGTSAQRRTAVGGTAQATGNWSTATGYDAWATGSQSTATGYQARATGSQSTAMGRGARAEGNRALALGLNTLVNEIDTGEIRVNDLRVRRSLGIGATRLGLFDAGGTLRWLSGDQVAALGSGAASVPIEARRDGTSVFTVNNGQYGTAITAFATLAAGVTYDLYLYATGRLVSSVQGQAVRLYLQCVHNGTSIASQGANAVQQTDDSRAELSNGEVISGITGTGATDGLEIRFRVHAAGSSNLAYVGFAVISGIAIPRS